MTICLSEKDTNVTTLSYPFAALTGMHILSGLLIPLSFLPRASAISCRSIHTSATLISMTSSHPSSVLMLMSSLLRPPRVT